MPGLRILFRGWFEIPHSYSMVNCFQIVHLYKNYGDKITFYIEEMPYFRETWNNARKLVYNETYNEIIRSFKKWSGEPVDLVYSITYPYDIRLDVYNNGSVDSNDSMDLKVPVPKCVFYTSEFATLETHYFNPNIGNGISNQLTDQFIKEYVANNPKLYMTSPSVWSSLGMEKYKLPSEKNRIITHGVDPEVFVYNNRSRRSIREFYKIADTDILMLNIGAMTKNKGMLLILYLLHIFVNQLGKTHYRLLLKGTGDLYESKRFLEIYFEELQTGNVMTRDDMNRLLRDHIIFTDKTLSYAKINDLFNAADLYLSPYLAEGFNLTSLEALSSGLPVVIPRTGSTREYVNDIYSNGGDKHIYYLDSEVIDTNGMKQNVISMDVFVKTVLERESSVRDLQRLRDTGALLNYPKYVQLRKYIEREYSWDRVSDLLYDYFLYIKNKNC